MSHSPITTESPRILPSPATPHADEQDSPAGSDDSTVQVNPRRFGVYMDSPPNFNLDMSHGTGRESISDNQAAKGIVDAQGEPKTGLQADIASASGDERSRKSTDVPKEMAGGNTGLDEGIYFIIKEDGSIAPSTADGTDAF
ncbi:hypothetical protein K488DRAFT_86702 [Vararia minispora EC-137]|uniref:Uncharacterized protein n=1 Tax=Vararia minispora EC-137 TaxID=1314806 RepID=A0ACB8QIC0_9AGAM|nr:hypothetical protein K488DRAFT_86702 [Vararia minispora EC-137]